MIVLTTIVSATFVCDNPRMTETATAAPARSNGVGRKTTPHGEAWAAITHTHAAITGRLQEALANADLPPLPWYEVLATVSEAEDERMKMGELAEALVISRGGLTKLVDRLVKAGLLERTYCETDRRVSYATLLPAGTELLGEMRPLVVAELELAFSANISTRQAEELKGTLERVQVTACGNA
jgi:DNA-binding MarR family transcriptional regulator